MLGIQLMHRGNIHPFAISPKYKNLLTALCPRFSLLPAERGVIQPLQTDCTCELVVANRHWLYGQIGFISLAGLTSARKRVLSVRMRPSIPCHCTWTGSPLTPAFQHLATGYPPTQTAKYSAPEGKGLGVRCRKRDSCWHIKYIWKEPWFRLCDRCIKRWEQDFVLRESNQASSHNMRNKAPFWTSAVGGGILEIW